MRKFIPFVSLSVIFGVLISWGEGMLPLLNYKSFNIVDFAFLSLLLSLLVMLLLVIFSGNFVNALFSIIFYVGAYLGTKFYFGYPINLKVYVYSGILLVSGLLTGFLLYTGKHFLRSLSQGKPRIRKDVAMPTIFFLISILFSAFVVLAEQNAMYSILLNYFYSYLYFLVSLTLIIAVFSFNEISGFLIGLFSIPIYFLMNRMIANDFNISFLLYNEKNFLALVSTYALLFAISTLIIGYAGRVFINGVMINRIVRSSAQISKESVSVKNSDKDSEKSSKGNLNKNVFTEKSSAAAKDNGNEVNASIEDKLNRKNEIKEIEQIDDKSTEDKNNMS